MANKKYKIWDKTSDVITPIGEVLTPEEWIARRPISAIVPTVVAGGVINGAFFGVYDEMLDIYERMGCDFSNCTTEQEHLDAIEVFENNMINNANSSNNGEQTDSSVWDDIALAIEKGVNEV